MNYEKKYKEAQKWIESIYSELSHEQQMEAEAFFPELKESEDERIRKAILELVRQSYPILEKKNQEQMIAWLEKQEGCECIKKDWLEHIKQSWYKEGFIDGKYSGGTSKEWTINDAAIFKEIIDFLENGTAKLQHDLTKYANWLKIQFTPIEKQGRQFSVDKLKPKFKVGDWVVDNCGYVWKIEGILNQFYILEGVEGGESRPTIEWVNKVFHLWTIKDAKDGDVLACNNGWTCIFKTLVNDETFSSYCFMDKTKWFCETGSECHTLKEEFVKAYNGKIHPATKEQCDTLIKAMTDAGWEFDFEKKELKKVEQKSAWSKEDTFKVQRICKYLDEAKKYYADITEVRDCIDWLKSIKERIGGNV